MNYYNDNNEESCAWLRELIAAGQIPDGWVDQRSIQQVRADDLLGYVQCHFFAGIGGWALARYGYVPNAVQSVHALLGIRVVASVFAATSYFLGVVCLFFYKIDKRLNIRITGELAERRSKYAPLPD